MRLSMQFAGRDDLFRAPPPCPSARALLALQVRRKHELLPAHKLRGQTTLTMTSPCLRSMTSQRHRASKIAPAHSGHSTSLALVRYAWPSDNTGLQGGNSAPPPHTAPLPPQPMDELMDAGHDAATANDDLNAGANCCCMRIACSPTWSHPAARGTPKRLD